MARATSAQPVHSKAYAIDLAKSDGRGEFLDRTPNVTWDAYFAAVDSNNYLVNGGAYSTGRPMWLVEVRNTNWVSMAGLGQETIHNMVISIDDPTGKVSWIANCP